VPIYASPEATHEKAKLLQIQGACFSAVRLFLWPDAFELSFEEGFDEAREWLDQPSTKAELERLCQESRAKHKHKAA
jgi:hypothetical protein